MAQTLILYLLAPCTVPSLIFNQSESELILMNLHSIHDLEIIVDTHMQTWACKWINDQSYCYVDFHVTQRYVYVQPMDTRLNRVYAIVTNRIDYCNSVLHAVISKKQLGTLQIVLLLEPINMITVHLK